MIQWISNWSFQAQKTQDVNPNKAEFNNVHDDFSYAIKKKLNGSYDFIGLTHLIQHEDIFIIFFYWMPLMPNSKKTRSQSQSKELFFF